MSDKEKLQKEILGLLREEVKDLWEQEDEEFLENADAPFHCSIDPVPAAVIPPGPSILPARSDAPATYSEVLHSSSIPGYQTLEIEQEIFSSPTAV